MFKETKEKLNKEEKYLKYLRENSNYYKDLNRSKQNYNKFKNDMKDKYKLRTLDKIDNAIGYWIVVILYINNNK